MLGTVPQQHSLTFLEKLFILRLVHSTNFTLQDVQQATECKQMVFPPNLFHLPLLHFGLILEGFGSVV